MTNSEAAPTRPGFQSAKPVRAYEAVVTQIEEAIFEGVYSPGERLPSERDLVTQFEVSRSTIREALRVLESDGLVRSRPGDPNGGAVIAPISSHRVAKALTSFVRRGQLGIVELVQFRMVVEGSAVRLAAAHHTDEHLSTIEQAYAAMQQAADGSWDAFSKADAAFHLAVSQCSGNQLLSACSDFATDMVLDLISDNLERSPDRPSLVHDTLRRHGAYLEAIKERDGAKAEALARRDLVEYYEPYVGDEGAAALRILM
jgi:GntR family transcriptional repressor for pyruvate dehydrogenase complex